MKPQPPPGHAPRPWWALVALLIAMTLGGLGLGAALVLWQTAAELVEPYWTLQLYGRLTTSKEGIEVATGPGHSVVLYKEPRPHTGKIASLQKGLIWKVGGQQLIEEGYGFGVPIVVVQGQAHNARHASIALEPVDGTLTVRKVYTMDTVDAPVQFMRRKYRPVAPIGEVAVTYRLSGPGVIDVEVDFTGLDVPWQQAYLMNEQGARAFRFYRDDTGLLLREDEIGIWGETTALRGCMISQTAVAQFCVDATPGGRLLYGRERYLQWNWRGIYTLSWAGVDIAVDGPVERYRYRITLQPDGAAP